jgi:hypothetical protein
MGISWIIKNDAPCGLCDGLHRALFDRGAGDTQLKKSCAIAGLPFETGVIRCPQY